MPFFQNPFPDEYRGSLVLGDRQHVPNFIVGGNAGRGHEIVTGWRNAPYDLSGNDADGDSKANLVLRYSLDADNFRNWGSLTIPAAVGAVSAAAVTAAEVVSSLNASAAFTSLFEATLDMGVSKRKVCIRQRLPMTRLHFYVQNGRAEEEIGFNLRSGVAELPTYFDRHSMANVFTYADSVNMLIKLDPSGSNVDAAVIDDAVDYNGRPLGLDSGTEQADWQLFKGKSGLFQFTKTSTATASSTTTEIIYSAGAVAGDLAMKVVTEKDGSGNTLRKFELPYTLAGGDLVTPP